MHSRTSKKVVPIFSEAQKRAAARIAKMVALRCVRNTSIEDIHAGKSPRSETGDYSDVKVVTPFGEIPWNEVSRMNDKEMKAFNKEVVNKIFTFLLHINNNEEIPEGPYAFYAPHDWDDPEVDPDIVQIFNRTQESTSK